MVNKEGLLPTLLRLRAPSCLVWVEEQGCCPHGGQGEQELAKGHHVGLYWALEVPHIPSAHTLWDEASHAAQPNTGEGAAPPQRGTVSPIGLRQKGGCLPFLWL